MNKNIIENRKIRILFVGEGTTPMYERAFYNASLSMNNLESSIFVWDNYVKKLRKSIIGRVCNKLAIGFTIYRINKELKDLCDKKKFDIVFLYSCRIIYGKTISNIKKTGAYVAMYCNDDPFSNRFPFYFWRHWIKGLSYSDIVYVYRNKNIIDCNKIGVKNVKLLRSYYNEDRLFYIDDSVNHINVPDVLFLGHYENDERVEYIEYLAENKVMVGVPNIGVWKTFNNFNKYIIKLERTHELYNKMLNKAKICLVFLSKINHDTYTRRCFEIPAVKTLMMSVYSDDIAKLFKENDEIVFFYNKVDLLKKIQFYLKNEEDRKKICEASYNRLVKDKHSSKDRVEQIINDFKLNNMREKNE